jgi:hypothetical protein
VKIVARGPNFFACGPDAYGEEIIVNGKKLRFEFDEIMGPHLLKKNGDPYKNQPGKDSPFWPPFYEWLKEFRAKKSAREALWKASQPIDTSEAADNRKGPRP